MAKRKKKRAATNSGGARRRGITVNVPELELARGHDGLLRGRPEPVIVLGAWLFESGALHLVGRASLGFRVDGPCPCVVRSGAAALTARSGPAVPRPPPDPADTHNRTRVIVVAAAIERDGGRGVSTMYSALADPASLLVWWPHAPVPEPRAIAEIAALDEPPKTSAIRLIHEGRDFSEHIEGDDWVGACLGVVDVGPAGANERLRMRFVDAQGRNDWTAILDVRLA